MPPRSTRPTDKFDDDDYPAYTMGRAAEMLGTTPAFLRTLGENRSDHPAALRRRRTAVTPATSCASRPAPVNWSTRARRSRTPAASSSSRTSWKRHSASTRSCGPTVPRPPARVTAQAPGHRPRPVGQLFPEHLPGRRHLTPPSHFAPPFHCSIGERVVLRMAAESAAVEFRIDRRSGVATYLQIVQQTKQALRLGVLEPGDSRLPTAREVVEATAISEHRPQGLPGAGARRPRRGPPRARHLRAPDARRRARRDRRRRAPAHRTRRLGPAGPGGRAGEGRRRRALHRRTGQHLQHEWHERHGFRGPFTRGSRNDDRRRDRGTRPRKDLRAQGGGHRALHDCSFRLPAGRVCALVGPNGAGKSTLLNLAAGLDRPGAGTLAVLGSTDPAAVRDRIAYVARTSRCTAAHRRWTRCGPPS